MKYISIIFFVVLLQACTSSKLDYCEITSNECTFVLLEDAESKIYIVNEERAAEQYTPASTFKIANSLIALETGVLSGVNQRLSVDLNTYPEESWWLPAWATETFDLRGAFQNSVFPIYRSIASDISNSAMQQYIEHFDYGNRDISSGIDNFWVAGSLEISALEQTAFLQKLYANDFTLAEDTLNGLKEIMLVEETDSYKLYAKSGAALVENDEVILWYVEFVENNEDVQFFAFNMHRPASPDNTQLRIDLTRHYLQSFGVI